MLPIAPLPWLRSHFEKPSLTKVAPILVLFLRTPAPRLLIVQLLFSPWRLTITKLAVNKIYDNNSYAEFNGESSFARYFRRNAIFKAVKSKVIAELLIFRLPRLNDMCIKSFCGLSLNYKIVVFINFVNIYGRIITRFTL